MPFSFRFEKILDFKKRLEEKLRSELVALEMKRLKAVKDRERLLEELEELRREFLKKQEEGVSGGEIQLYMSLLGSLSLLIARKEDEIKSLEREIEEKRREIMEASKERRKFERLKEKAYEAYRYEEALRERKVLDEIGLNLFMRRGKGGS